FHQLVDIVERHRLRGEGRVGAALFQLAGHVADERERRSHRPGADADTRDAKRLELTDRRRAGDRQDVDRSADAGDQRADRLGIADARYEDAVGAGVEKRLAALDGGAETRLRRTERTQKDVRARVDDDPNARLVRRLDDRADLVDLQHERFEI